MIRKHATPPRFGTQPVDDDQDDLFALRDHTCTDCGQAFQTSRRAARCALCASLRTGQVGPATVQCPGCGVEHQIPILAPHKRCPACADPEVLRARLEQAEEAATAAYTRLDADYAHADDQDRARYDAACEARASGLWRGQARPASFFAQQWEAAITRNDGLSPLLRARLAWDDASATLERARAAVEP